MCELLGMDANVPTDICFSFAGLMRRLDYLQGLGVTALWLMPFQTSPCRDDGYDISDYYQVNRAYGTLGDFVEFTHAARQRGIRELASFKCARIDLDGGIGCKVSNLSDTKGTLKVALFLNPPIEFEIEIEGESRKRYCAIAWRRKWRTGVYFV